MKNRLSLLLTAALACHVTSPVFAQASTYPTKPIRILVGAPAGGPTDVIARALSRKMGESLGQPIIIENRGGAAGTLAADIVAKSAADGYTLILTPSAHSYAPSMYERLPFDPVKDFTSVGQIGVMPLVAIANNSLPASTLKDLIGLAKAQPGAINYGSSGIGSGHHLAGELLKSRAEINIVHVPYKGSAASIADLIGGQIQVIFEPLVSALPQIRGGKVKALAVMGEKRVRVLPDVPTARESGVTNVEVSAWYGVMAPGRTPEHIVTKLNTALNGALTDPSTRSNLEAQGVEVTVGPPQMFMELISTEILRWRPIIQKAGIRAE